MASVIDLFKAQQEAAEALHARLTQVAALMSNLLAQVDQLRLNGELKSTLEAEQQWLEKTQHVLRDVRSWRERESREVRRSAIWRWSTAIAFALAVSTATAAGFMWARQLYAAEVERLQSRAGLADLVDRRIAQMTPVERQQFERLMKLPPMHQR